MNHDVKTIEQKDVDNLVAIYKKLPAFETGSLVLVCSLVTQVLQLRQPLQGLSLRSLRLLS